MFRSGATLMPTLMTKTINRLRSHDEVNCGGR